MKKMLSLIKACMTDNMSLFKIKSNKKFVPFIITGIILFYMWGIANIAIDKFSEVHVEWMILTLFVFSTSILSIIQGIYKSGSLLFNCKDDDLLLSLPIKRTTVIFIRIFKFYVYELLYNSLFLVPAIIAYGMRTSFTTTYVVTSIVMTLLLPIIPILLSCLIGAFTSGLSSKSKAKNVIQTLLSFGLVLGMLYLYMNIDKFANYILENATSVQDIIGKIYYPAGVYYKLLFDFNILDLLLFIVINIVLLIIVIFIINTIYFKINTNLKSVSTSKHKTGKVVSKKRSVLESLIIKEYKKFINTPVFIVNAFFGVVLFLILAIALGFKFDAIMQMILSMQQESIDKLKNIVPLVMYGFLTFCTFTSSLTGCMISLEGKSFNILKTIPVKTSTIIKSKVYAAISLMIPFIIAGYIFAFIRFKFTILEIVMSLGLAIILPLVSQLFGIIINIYYPKLDSDNDTEIVKQSVSSLISVMIGMLLTVLSVVAIYKLIDLISINLIILLFTLSYSLIALLLYLYAKNISSKEFDKLVI
jgi:ABC-2 type transport system permease protein